MNTNSRTLIVALVVLPALALAGYLIAERLSPSRTDQATAPAGKTYRSGPFLVTVGLQPETPQVGDNRLSLRITDAAGEPVSGARIKAYGEMPAMGAMAAMRAPADLEEIEPGHYVGPLELEMGGEWPLSLVISKEGLGETRLGFDMATGRPGLRISSGGARVDTRRQGPEGKPMAGDMPSDGSRPQADAQGYYIAGPFRIKPQVLPAGAPPAMEDMDDDAHPGMAMDEMDDEAHPGAAMGSVAEIGTLQAGENRLQLRVSSLEREPVRDAELVAVAQWLDEDGEVLGQSPLARFTMTEPGLYQGRLSLEQDGPYSLAIDVKSEQLGHGDLILSTHGDTAGLQAETATPEGISHYTCSMHPSVREAKPGSCPICSMDLIPVTKEEVASGTVTIDARRRQLIGVQTARAAPRDLVKVIRAVGQIAYDERRVSDVSLKFGAWIGELQADAIGDPVQRGQVLFTVYSPQLLSAQQEYLETRQRLARRGPNDSLLAAARQRLMLWDIPASELRRIEQRGTPLEYLPIHAPAGGIVVEKNIVQGSHAMAGQTLLRIADLSRVWVDAEVYEADLPLLSQGMAATVTLPYLPVREFAATVDYIYPYLESKTRTARIRLLLDNPNGLLKPDMYAEVKLQAELGRHLAIPEEAVLVAGESRVVFVDLGEGKLKPVKVETGQRVAGWVVIDEGLEAGDTVVTSGNFLIAAEAKLKTGIDQW